MNPLKLPLPELLLRAAVAFSFLYPPIAALNDPDSWLGYFPGFLLALAGSNEILMLHAFGVVEVIIALWITFGRNVFIPSAIAVVMLAAIVLVNDAQFPILFRDVSIALASLSLALMHRTQRPVQTS